MERLAILFCLCMAFCYGQQWQTQNDASKPNVWNNYPYNYGYPYNGAYQGGQPYYSYPYYRNYYPYNYGYNHQAAPQAAPQAPAAPQQVYTPAPAVHNVPQHHVPQHHVPQHHVSAAHNVPQHHVPAAHNIPQHHVPAVQHIPTHHVPAAPQHVPVPGQVYHGGLVFIGKFEGTCDDNADGLYYIDERSFAYCTGGRKSIQACAGGSANPKYSHFKAGERYQHYEFCSINLAAQL